MVSTLVDSNILIDVVSGDPDWEDWSASGLISSAEAGRLAINAVVFAEVSVGFGSIERCAEALDALDLERHHVPYEAAFLAGKAFLSYRRRGGSRRSPLPDFFIGAHAAVAGMRLLTRDPARYADYFPKLELVAP